MDSNYGRGGVTSNEDVLRNFCTNSSEVKANNLSTHYDSSNDEVLLRQYGTLIAKRKGDKVMITAKRYSVTTSKVQNELLRLAMEYGLDVQKTNEFAKGGKVKSLNDGLEVYAENDLQLKVIQDIIPILDKKGIKLRFAVKVGKFPQSIIFDNHYRDSALVIPGKGYESEYLPVWYDNEFQDANEFENLETNPSPYLPNLDDRDEYAKGGKTKVQKNKILTTIEKQQYLKLIAAEERAYENLKDLEHNCFVDQYRLEDKISGAHNNLEKFIHKMYKKYGDEIEREINTDIFAKGGDIAQGNYEMILSQAKEVEHHVEELQSILKAEKDIDAWVVAKMENVSSTLSDITHYLDGKTEYAHGGKMSRGGYFGKDALVKDLDDEFASEELLAKFRKKSGIKDTQLTKPNVIAFAYTDYGGDFMDKVAIEYFLENYPKNIVVENTGYNGKNAIVWGKVAMDWVEATEDYAFGYEDFESFYYDKVYKEEEQAFSEYLYELQGSDTHGFSRFGSYELDYDEVLQWLLENKGGYYTIMTTGLDFNSDDLTQELLAEGLIEKSEEYAKGGMIGAYSVVLEADDIKNSSFLNYLKRNGIKHEILSVQYQTAEVKFIGSKEALTKMIDKFWVDMEESEMQEMYDSIQKNEYAKGGNINSKTNKKMATKKVKDGQSAPQTDRWIFAYKKGGYNYYTQKEVPYKKVVDANKKGAPVGYRFSKFAEEKGLTNNRFRKPTKSEVEQYAGKKKNGKLIMYRETRSNKSDVNPKKKI